MEVASPSTSWSRQTKPGLASATALMCSSWERKPSMTGLSSGAFMRARLAWARWKRGEIMRPRLYGRPAAVSARGLLLHPRVQPLPGVPGGAAVGRLLDHLAHPAVGELGQGGPVLHGTA